MYESGEMYLETILVLKKTKEQVRSIDIAKKLNFSKPSVSRGVGLLKKDGFIKIDDDGYIELTDKGIDKANAIYERHQILTEFLEITAKVDRDIAEDDACRIEHILSEETFDGIKKYLLTINK